MASHNQPHTQGPPTCPLTGWRLLTCLALPLAAAAAQGPDPRRTGGGGGGGGSWGPWGPWSPCSGTCGGGASFRTRPCLRFPEEQPCPGPPRQYRACSLEVGETPTIIRGRVPGGHAASCTPFLPSVSARTARRARCPSATSSAASTTGSPSRGAGTPTSGSPSTERPTRATWPAWPADTTSTTTSDASWTERAAAEPRPGTSASAGAAGERAVTGRWARRRGERTPAASATAGTPAASGWRGSSGRPSRPPVIDRRPPPVCPAPQGFFGYKNVTRIPPGARHIKVTDRSRNYLALMDAQQRFLLNGDWTVDRPGLYPAVGTEVRYSRTADVLETLEAPGPTREELTVMVLFQAPNPGVEFEFWVPKEGGRGPSPLRRQQQTREAQAERPPEAPAATAPPQRERCGECPAAKGKSRRLHHYCSSDFVFRAQILSRRSVGRETRYDLRVVETYRNRFPLERREFAWAAGPCACPLLEEGRHYLLMARRHVNFEGTLNRLLLPRGGYARPWTPREDRQARQLAGRCP